MQYGEYFKDNDQKKLKNNNSKFQCKSIFVINNEKVKICNLISKTYLKIYILIYYYFSEYNIQSLNIKSGLAKCLNISIRYYHKIYISIISL